MKVESIGVISSLGIGIEETILNIESGNNVQFEKASDPCDAYIATIRKSNSELIKLIDTKNNLDNFSRAELLSIFVINDALKQNSLDFSKLNSERVGLYCGTSLSAMDKLERYYESYVKGDNTIDENELLHGDFSMIIDRVADHFGFYGPRVLLSTACSSSTLVLQMAQSDIVSGTVDYAIVFGVDPITNLTLIGFKALDSLANTPTSPFSIQENGLSLGEGAAALVLSNKKSNNNSDIYLVGVGASMDGYHPTAPDPTGKGVEKAFSLASNKDLNVDPVIAHGSGTELNDQTESKLINRLYNNGDKPYIVSTKGATGHTLGASGVINNAIACAALKHRLIPPCFGFKEKRPECIGNFPTKSIKLDSIKNVVSHAFGFGGNNALAIFSKEYKPDQFVSQKESAVITVDTVGLMTPLGETLDELCERLISGKQKFYEKENNLCFSGKRSSKYASHVGNLDIYKSAGKILRLNRRIDRLSRICLLALYSLIDNSKSNGLPIDIPNTEIYSGFGSPPLEVLEKFYSSYLRNGVRFVQPSLFTNTVSNAALGHAAQEFGFKSAAFAIPQFTLSGAISVHYAFKSLMNDTAASKSVICGASDEYSQILEKGMLELDLISNSPEDFQVFDTTNNGFVLGEGAIYLALSRGNNDGTKGLCEITSSYLGSEPCKPGTFPIYWKVLKEQLLKYVNCNDAPDLIIVNAMGLRIVDTPLKRCIQSVFGTDKPIFSPIQTYGQSPGLNALLGIISAIAVYKYGVFPKNTINPICGERKKNISSALIITVKVGGGFSIINTRKRL